MLLHKDPLFSIYFGDERDQIFPSSYLNTPEDFTQSEPSAKIKKALAVDAIVVLRQVHGDDGYIIETLQQAGVKPFCQPGDYLITQLPNIGIAVATADCLPLILYDKVTNTIAVVHAGWRGSVASVAIKALARMQKELGTKPEHVRVFFGPSAGICCYAVDEKVIKELEPFWFADQVLRKKNGGIYFDLPLFNELQLIDEGIKKENIKRTYHECTICDESFCSYRRQGEKAGRQMTVVALQ